MILDYRNMSSVPVDGDLWTGVDIATCFQVVDPATGEEIPEPIFYADDESGFYRHYLRDERGNFFLRRDDGTKVEGRLYDYADYDTCSIASGLRRRPIKIVPRPDLEPKNAAIAARLLEGTP